jgi:hypothetical protein
MKYFIDINIDKAKLPSIEAVNSWSSQQFKNAVTHDQLCPEYNSNIRQLLHVGYKVKQ